MLHGNVNEPPCQNGVVGSPSHSQVAFPHILINVSLHFGVFPSFKVPTAGFDWLSQLRFTLKIQRQVVGPSNTWDSGTGLCVNAKTHLELVPTSSAEL